MDYRASEYEARSKASDWVRLAEFLAALGVAASIMSALGLTVWENHSLLGKNPLFGAGEPGAGEKAPKIPNTNQTPAQTAPIPPASPTWTQKPAQQQVTPSPNIYQPEDPWAGTYAFGEQTLSVNREGDVIILRYDIVKKSMSDLGVKTGDVFARLVVNGQQITGEANLRSAKCGPVPYHIDGTLGVGEITFQGRARLVDPDTCVVSKTIEISQNLIRIEK